MALQEQVKQNLHVFYQDTQEWTMQFFLALILVNLKNGEGITELHKLFDWANNSKKGLIIS